MIKYPAITYRLFKDKLFSASLLSIGIGLILSVNAPETFAKTKSEKITNTTSNKIVKHKSALPLEQSLSTKTHNIKSVKEITTLKPVANKNKQTPLQNHHIAEAIKLSKKSDPVKTDSKQSIKETATLKSLANRNKPKSLPVQIVSKKTIKEIPILKSVANKGKQKPLQIHIATDTHNTNKQHPHTVLTAKSRHTEPQEEISTLSLASEPTETNERIQSLIAPPSNDNDIVLSHSTPINNQVTGPVASVHGVIDQSLRESATNAGLTDELIQELTSVFAWDIDFANNLDQGDKFTLVYEQGTDGANPQIVAAEFTNRGRILTALRYTTPDGTVNYFSPEGKPMRKSFLSAPLDYLKISSGFSTHRKHPILNRIRAHKGVDYAARTGTPVKSAGDGEIKFAGNQGGYGQMLIVKHGEHYETVYAHLSDFKDGLEAGDTVKQGEVIGYVGQTGLATGPHLHYEFRVDGQHRNPEALNTARSAPLHDEILADFKDQTKANLNLLNKTKARSLLARN